MATSQIDITSDEIINIKCCLCLEDNWIREADKYCVQCKNYCCTPCTGTHKKFPSMKDHKLLDKADFRSLDGSLPSLPTQRCSEHPTEVINLYCKQHDEVACESCIAFKHRTCLNIHSMTDLVDKLYKRTQLDRIESSPTREISDINKLIDAMNEAASKLTMSEGNPAQEFVSIRTSQTVSDKADNVEKEQQRKTHASVSFTADQNIKTFLQKPQALGKVSSVNLSITKQKNSLYKVKQQREIDVKLADDFIYCDIFGSCITKDGCILLADYNNKKLKRLDMSAETVKDYIDLQSEPKAVCLINNIEAAVTLSILKAVQFVSLVNKLTVTRTVTLNHNCWGLAHLANKLFISDGEKTVYIHDMNGKQLQTISTDASDKDIFQKTRHITVSATVDRVLVADWSKGLVILDHKGKYLTTLTNPTVSHTYGVCTDGRNLFVCGWSSHNIVIGKNYELLGKIGMVDSPRSLCFDPHKNRLVVTSDNNNITVLKLEKT